VCVRARVRVCVCMCVCIYTQDDCAQMYWDKYRLLLVIFYEQIGIMCIRLPQSEVDF